MLPTLVPICNLRGCSIPHLHLRRRPAHGQSTPHSHRGTARSSGRSGRLQRHAQRLVPGHVPGRARLAVVVGATEANIPDQTAKRPVPVIDEPSRFATRRATHARPAVSPFFRPVRAVSKAWATRPWTRSRSSNSVWPKISASGLDTSVLLRFAADDLRKSLGLDFLFGSEDRCGHETPPGESEGRIFRW